VRLFFTSSSNCILNKKK